MGSDRRCEQEQEQEDVWHLLVTSPDGTWIFLPSFPLWLTCVCLDRDRMSLSGGLDRIGEVQIVIVDYLCYDGCGCCTPRTVLEDLLR